MGFYMGPLLWEFLLAFVLYQSDHILLDELYMYILCFGLTFRNDYGHYFPRLQSEVLKYKTNLELLPIILTSIQPLQSSKQIQLNRSWRQYGLVSIKDIRRYTRLFMLPIPCFEDSPWIYKEHRLWFSKLEKNRVDNTTIASPTFLPS